LHSYLSGDAIGILPSVSIPLKKPVDKRQLVGQQSLPIVFQESQRYHFNDEQPTLIFSKH
jgi:hypothetical protein